jgi:hypothetical protein
MSGIAPDIAWVLPYIFSVIVPGLQQKTGPVLAYAR